ncbi:hypothetical protein MPDQ_005838 [Monascus purpureus]|uniref:endo-1,3(4)-beta-glucanase n=1 Tax=Monascus purpureus TaxID=5098 RepID=A0A507QZM1_MONPU|nr:hypothetical protein MPDQ_005838 [Monascus purpureus]BDD61011.1 hypothetical protein MAP00_006094 [Monascus purpureus]
MPSSSLLLSVATLAISTLVSPSSASSVFRRAGASYQLVESWQGESFFDYFDFFTETDPTHGFVTYLDQSSAESSGLVNVTSSGSVYLGVDHTTVLQDNGPGRNSVRISSKKYYEQGLFIADIQHMPGSICGVWPALWTVGKDWPQDGELDIIEGVNQQQVDEIVAHTGGECTLTNTGMTGQVTASDCSLQGGTSGCTANAGPGSYGNSFNENQGGVYAIEWTSDFIKIWIFPRSSIPESITSGNPDVSTFGTPVFRLEDSCKVSEQFLSQQFIIDTTFCGDWAGGVFLNSGCPLSNPNDATQSCVNYVASNPSAFTEAYWEINYIKVYQNTTGQASSSVAVPSSSSVVPASESTPAPVATSSVPGDPPSGSTLPSPADTPGATVPSATTELVVLTTTICPESLATSTTLVGGSSVAPIALSVVESPSPESPAPEISTPNAPGPAPTSPGFSAASPLSSTLAISPSPSVTPVIPSGASPAPSSFVPVESSYLAPPASSTVSGSSYLPPGASSAFPLATGAANKASFGMPGVIGAVAIALLV